MHFNTDFDNMGSAGDKNHEKQRGEEEKGGNVYVDKLDRTQDVNVTPQHANLPTNTKDNKETHDGDDFIITTSPKPMPIAINIINA